MLYRTLMRTFRQMIYATSGLGEPELAEWLEDQQRRNTAAPIDALRIASYGLNAMSLTANLP